jgi:hypothetical protein
VGSGVLRLHHYDVVEDELHDDRAWDASGAPLELPTRHYAAIQLRFGRDVPGARVGTVLNQVTAHIQTRPEIEVTTVEYSGRQVVADEENGDGPVL